MKGVEDVTHHAALVLCRLLPPLRALLEHPAVSVRTAAGQVVAMVYSAARNLKAHLQETGLTLQELKGETPTEEGGEVTDEGVKGEGTAEAKGGVESDDEEDDNAWEAAEEINWSDDAPMGGTEGSDDESSDEEEGMESKAGKGRGAWGSERKMEEWEGPKDSKGSWDWEQVISQFKIEEEPKEGETAEAVSSKGVVSSAKKGKVARAAGGTVIGTAAEMEKAWDLRAIEDDLVENIRQLSRDARRYRKKKDRRVQKAEFRAIEAAVLVR